MDDRPERAFGFSGHWRDYAPIAFTNLLLTVVTLGIYRFWATTRTRHYLWSNTRFIDAPLEWTGTGKELFVGFLIVMALLFVPLFIIQFGAQALIIRGYYAVGFVLLLIALVALAYLVGLARYRALRYRLSRTFWHGIRGGSNDGGLRYGLSYMWRTVAGTLPLYLGTPWAMMTLWNMRWNRMSFGSEPFKASGRTGPVFKAFLLFYLLPILSLILAIAAAGTFGGRIGDVVVISNFPPILRIIAYVVIVLAVYALLGIIALVYYSAYLREAIGHLSLGGLEFSFDADLDDWVSLALGDIALVVGTLGIGSIFLSYRHWKFFVTHIEAAGEVDLAALTQSRTREPGQGEGLLDAFDIGAF